MIGPVTSDTGNRFAIQSSEIVSWPFIIRPESETVVRFSHVPFDISQQDFTINVWISERREGQPLQAIPMSFRWIKPSRQNPFTFSFQAAVGVVDAVPIPPMIQPCNAHVIFPPTGCSVDWPRVTIWTEKMGTHHVNVQNLSNRMNRYNLEIVELQNPICASPC